MPTFVTDTFTDTGATDLASHTGETGATWSKVSGQSGSLAITTSPANLLRGNTALGRGAYIASGTPASANYYAEADLVFINNLTSAEGFLLVHIDGSGFGYHGGYRGGSTNWEIGLYATAGNAVTGGTASAAGYTTGNTYRIRLVVTVSGSTSTLSLYDVTGGGNTLLCSGTDTNFPSTGKAGVSMTAATSPADDTHGIQIDNFTAGDWPIGGAYIAPSSIIVRQSRRRASFF